MVPAEDQGGIPEGSLAFVMSLRAVGEGHISSITFRRGTIDTEGHVSINPSTLQVRSLKRQENQSFKKSDFKKNLEEMSVTDELVDVIVSSLPDQFTSLMLEQRIEYYEHKWENKEALVELSML